MKTLIILLMATSAINAFFIGDRAREDFIDALRRIFLNTQQGSFLPPPLGMSEMEKIRNRFDSLTLDEQERLKNYLFGERFPRPMPAHHPERSPTEFDEEKLKQRREKWEAMTPEEREEHIKNHRKEQPYHITRLSPEFDEENFNEMQEKWESMTPEEREEHMKNHREEQPYHITRLSPEFDEEMQEKWESMTPEEREEHIRNYWREQPATPYHSIKLNTKFDEEKLKKMREKWEAMKPEEREEFIRNHKREQPMTPYNLVYVKLNSGLNEEKLKELREKFEAMTEEERKEYLENHRKHPKEEQGEIKIRSPRSIAIKPLPEIELKRPTRPVEDNRNNGNNLVRSPRVFQPIRPLSELISSNELEVNKRPIRPAAQSNEVDHSQIVKILDEMSVEERTQFFRELFPDGMPIKPIGIVPAGNRIQPIVNDKEVYAEYVPIVPSSVDNGRTRIVDSWARDRFLDIKEPQMRPRPKPEIPYQPEWNNRLPPRPVPAQFQPIIPLDFQPILPLEFQPILPLPDMRRPARPASN